MPLKKRTPVSLIHIDAVSKRLYMTLKKRPFLKKTGVRFLKGIYGRFETAIIWLSKTDERFLRGIYKWLFRND